MPVAEERGKATLAWKYWYIIIAKLVQTPDVRLNGALLNNLNKGRSSLGLEGPLYFNSKTVTEATLKQD